MRAVVLKGFGGPEVLSVADVPDPVAGPEDVVVDVTATALNRADLLQRGGLYPPPPGLPDIPGLEYSGVVASVGERCSLRRLGDAVMGIVGGGGYAERVAVHERQTIPVPASVPVPDAAAIPEVFITAWDALVIQGGLTSGRWALVHAGASGVGTAAIQLAVAVGARVAVTCSAGKAEACRRLGAHLVLERSPHDWRADFAAAVPDGAAVVLDVIGGDEVDRNLDALALKGRLVQVGFMGSGPSLANIGKLMAKRAAIIGTVLRPRPLEEKIAVSQRFAAEVVPLFDEGRLRPVIDSRFPLDRIADAHAYMEANANVGKILIDMR